ncbi:NAD(P)/FAD-dependent oxidoreductase [Palleronia sp. LCG004]|uniref:NAD(P)/FAD-dependent oxidoreductase n=1 Tax=Palleronia sp. LCG004 TaxID=3079304 RepID=UPI0029424EAA|nr:FAD-dependent oxidoreductase [Palleronia sp. LCG004]WOI55433.1 FAD-dependent oxidoreductase [Palleronia sp. LCG004]
MTHRSSPPRRRVAIVGGGISGLAAAYLLKDTHRVTLFEAAPRLGGHARTVMAGRHGDQPVDTGFIVFNDATYPNVTKLFDELGVTRVDSSMSFGVSARRGRIEYALHGIDAIFAQRRNLGDPRFLHMLRDLMRFNMRARRVVRPDMSIGDLLTSLGTGRWFRDYYILPFSGAIWSTPCAGILDFPAEALVRFFENHGLLGYSGQHRWYSVAGGSIEYVRRLERHLRQAGVTLRTGAAVRRVARGPLGVGIAAEGHPPEHFDEVILATHADVSARLLADPTPDERRALAKVRYQPNHMILHSDPGVMPRLKKVWASWTYCEPDNGAGDRIGVNYWMNSLQDIPPDDPLFVTLNASRQIDERLVFDETTFRHPVYDTAMLAAQREIRALNGTGGTWFCGAWMRNGFHEDGFASACDVVDAMGCRAPALLAAE